MSNENKTMTLLEQIESIPSAEPEPSHSLGPPVPDPSKALLARYPGETPRAFAAFTAFFTLGHRRSLQAVAYKLDLSIDTIKKWSSRHDWQSRVTKLDATIHQHEADLHVAAEKEAAADLLQRLETFREQEWDAAQKLLSAARCYLETFGDEDLSRMTLAQVSRALRISSQIGRLALAGAEPPPTPEAATSSPIQQQLLDSLARLSAHNNIQRNGSGAQRHPDESGNPQPSTSTTFHVAQP